MVELYDTCFGQKIVHHFTFLCALSCNSDQNVFQPLFARFLNHHFNGTHCFCFSWYVLCYYFNLSTFTFVTVSIQLNYIFYSTSTLHKLKIFSMQYMWVFMLSYPEEYQCNISFNYTNFQIYCYITIYEKTSHSFYGSLLY